MTRTARIEVRTAELAAMRTLKPGRFAVEASDREALGARLAQVAPEAHGT